MNNPQVRVHRLSRLGLLFFVFGVLGTAANYAAAWAFPLRWGGPNIGAGMLQLLFYGSIVAGVAVLVSVRVRGRRQAPPSANRRCAGTAAAECSVPTPPGSGPGRR